MRKNMCLYNPPPQKKCVAIGNRKHVQPEFGIIRSPLFGGGFRTESTEPVDIHHPVSILVRGRYVESQPEC